MNDDDEREQPTDPAKLLPFSKRLIPEDPEAVDAGRHFIRDSVTNPADARV